MKNKKIGIFLLLAVLIIAVLAACAVTSAPEEFSLERFAEVNSHEKLMEKHSSYHMYIEYSNGISGGTYADSELHYTYLPNSASVYANGQCCAIQDGAFSVHLFAGVDPNLEWAMGLTIYDPEEELIEAVPDGEKLIVKTRLSEPSFGEDIEGGYCEYIYEMDRQDLRDLDSSYTSYTADGAEVFHVDYHVEYDVERPAQAQELFERMNPQEDYRTVTIVLDPGTEQEAVFTARTRRGDSVSLHLVSGFWGISLTIN